MKRIKIKIALAAVVALAWVIGAALTATAQVPLTTGSEFQTNRAGQTVPGVVQMCIDPASSRAVPCGSATTPTIVSGNTSTPTYSSAVTGQANSSAGDVYCVAASATKTVKVKGVRVSAIASAAIVSDVVINKRSTLNTGGTPTAVTVVPHSSENPPGTATVTSYATAPTPGTLVGAVRSQKLPITTTSGTLAPSPTLFQFSVYWDQPIILAKGSTEALCVTVASTAGGQWDVDHEHTEE